VVGERQIVCWCTAEYVSCGWCGIGIETIQAYQRRGLATATATAFLAHCAAHGIQPHWDCWANNVPSVRVAEKVGFALVEEYEVHCGRIEDLRDGLPQIGT
jgi:RimJ/RimL family protein N-acetyltransferase